MTLDQGRVTYDANGSAVAFEGAAVYLYQAAAIKSALGLYAKHKMRVNRMWTPTRMLAAASRLTGEHYKRGEYQRAIDGLQHWIDGARNTVEHVTL